MATTPRSITNVLMPFLSMLKIIFSFSVSPSSTGRNIFVSSLTLLQTRFGVRVRVATHSQIDITCERARDTRQAERRIFAHIDLNSFLIYTRFVCQKRMQSKNQCVRDVPTKETMNCGLQFSHRIIYCLSFGFFASFVDAVCVVRMTRFRCVFWCNFTERFLPTVIKLFENNNSIYEH